MAIINTNHGGMNRCLIRIVLPVFGTWSCNQWFLRPPFPFLDTSITNFVLYLLDVFSFLFCLVNDSGRHSFRRSQTARAVAPGVIQSKYVNANLIFYGSFM